jgi:hypothetical protein
MSPLAKGHALVAVHLPKTAGTTFRDALQRVYGDRLRLDYDDRPLAGSRWSRRATAARHALAHAGQRMQAPCTCGHFMPVKYATRRQARFCTWLRDPVQRVLSRYHHYLRHGQDETRHQRWGLVPGMDLEAFVRLPHYQDSYAEYLWMFPLARFDFIGIVEDYDAELQRFASHFGIDADLLAGEARNRNPDKADPAYPVEPAMERLIRACNPRDVALYERARAFAARRRAAA